MHYITLVLLTVLIRGLMSINSLLRSMSTQQPSRGLHRSPITPSRVHTPIMTIRHTVLISLVVLRGCSALFVAVHLLQTSAFPYLAGILAPLLVCVVLTARNIGRIPIAIIGVLLSIMFYTFVISDLRSLAAHPEIPKRVGLHPDDRPLGNFELPALILSALTESDYAIDGLVHVGELAEFVMPPMTTWASSAVSVSLYGIIGSAAYLDDFGFDSQDTIGTPGTWTRVLSSLLLALWGSQAGMDAAAIITERGRVLSCERGQAKSGSNKAAVDAKDWLLLVGVAMVTIGVLVPAPRKSVPSDTGAFVGIDSILMASILLHAVAVMLGHTRRGQVH